MRATVPLHERLHVNAVLQMCVVEAHGGVVLMCQERRPGVDWVR
jgi:hypothetical protein